MTARAEALLRALAVVCATAGLGSCAATRAGPASGGPGPGAVVVPARPPCASSVRAFVPERATSWVFVRPRAVFAHARLGRAMARAFDDAGEAALYARARRVGYDVRTVERAMLAWTPTGTLAVGLGSFDTERIVALLWDRLLPPRRRGEAPRAPDAGVLLPGLARIEGVLARSPVALAADGVCGLVAWAEGGDTRRVDRVLAGSSGAPAETVDPTALVVWHTRELPAALRRTAGEALLDGVRALELTVDLAEAGVELRLVLEGSSPADGVARVHRALEVFATGALGEATGASEWLGGERVRVRRTERALELEVGVPWRGIDALADVLRGDVGGDAFR